MSSSSETALWLPHVLPAKERLFIQIITHIRPEPSSLVSAHAEMYLVVKKIGSNEEK